MVLDTLTTNTICNIEIYPYAVKYEGMPVGSNIYARINRFILALYNIWTQQWRIFIGLYPENEAHFVLLNIKLISFILMLLSKNLHFGKNYNTYCTGGSRKFERVSWENF